MINGHVRYFNVRDSCFLLTRVSFSFSLLLANRIPFNLPKVENSLIWPRLMLISKKSSNYDVPAEIAHYLDTLLIFACSTLKGCMWGFLHKVLKKDTF